jgi:hypothetical protein
MSYSDDLLKPTLTLLMLHACNKPEDLRKLLEQFNIRKLLEQLNTCIGSDSEINSLDVPIDITLQNNNVISEYVDYCINNVNLNMLSILNDYYNFTIDEIRCIFTMLCNNERMEYKEISLEQRRDLILLLIKDKLSSYNGQYNENIHYILLLIDEQYDDDELFKILIEILDTPSQQRVIDYIYKRSNKNNKLLSLCNPSLVTYINATYEQIALADQLRNEEIALYRQNEQIRRNNIVAERIRKQKENNKALALERLKLPTLCLLNEDPKSNFSMLPRELLDHICTI